MTDHSDTSRKIPIVGIGASAGGLEAFKIFFGKMPADTGMAFVLIPHLDPAHKSLMVEIIGRHSAMPAAQVEKRMAIAPNHIYIVPPNRNLAIEEGKLVPCEISRQRGINLPVDFFFRSLADAQNERAIGVILSGTMSDGTMGLKEIKENGGLVIAQAPETAQHDGMPQSAINTGMVDLILPVPDMPEAIIKFIAHPYIHGESKFKDEDELNQVLAVVHARSRHDFRCYKRNTLVRRTERRMGLRQIEKMTDYVDILKSEPNEADALHKDLLIGVTGFFREEQVWEKVDAEILPPLLKKKDPDTPLRIWISACSTGEEAYTIAILAHDAFRRLNRRYNAQIFATDIDGDAIVAARSGVYPESVAANLSPEHLEKYFVREDRGYRVLRKIRESVVFAVQNLLGDAPFSNLDIISCRNLLIYLEPDVQKKVIELFHFALREGGCLVLGNSETIGYHHHLFETVSKECRIYRATGRKDEPVKMPILANAGGQRGVPFGMRPEAPRKSMAQLMQTQLLKRFAPPSVLINKKYEIVNLFGPTENYLQMPQGDPAMDLMSMVREGLRIKMRAAVHKAVKKKETVTVSGARVKRDGRHHPVRFTVGPVQGKSINDTLFLITFETEPSSAPDTATQSDLADGEEPLVRQLEAELMNTREELQNTIEELETSNEELKASNEEMMSMNEELQSSNEELETSKEELQSMNEELNTVNTELCEKIDEIERANNDLVNLMNSTEVATIFLNMDTTIRRFTPSAKNLFNLIPSDVGRPIGDLSRRFSDDDMHDQAMRVMETLAPASKEVKAENGFWYIRRILPFRIQDNQVDGLVLTFADVTEMKGVEAELRVSERKFRNLAENMPGLVMKYKLNPDDSDELLYISKGVADLYEVSQEDALNNNKLLWDRIHKDDLAKYFASVKASAQNLSFWEQEHRLQLPDGRVKWLHNRGVPFKQEDGGVVWDSLSVDITDRKKAEEALRETHALLQQVIDNSLALIVAKNQKGEYILANHISARLLGCQKHEMIGKTDYDFFPKETADRLAEDDGKVFKTGKSLRTEEQFQIGDQNYTFTTTKFPLFDANGELYALCGMATDITERKRMESELQSALAEKEILLREIHHRVKNNMQVIIGLLRMHARRVDDAHLTEIFNDCRDRIGAMSLIHEALYQSENLAKIDFNAYLKKLCRNLSQAHDAPRRRIDLTANAANVSLNMDQGVAVGMIIAELISNAFKHAFPNDEGGTVSVHLDRPDGETIRLVVSDTGEGPPTDFDIRNPSSLGMRLVAGAVTRELGGTIDVERVNGTRFIIQFK